MLGGSFWTRSSLMKNANNNKQIPYKGENKEITSKN